MKFKFITKDNISRLPKGCGVYVFKKGRQILYIGKAANIKERVKNHFSQPAFRGNLFAKQADKIGYIKTDSEVEALILEDKLIKKCQPKYNVMWRDDKNYFFVGITKEDFPRVFVTHQPQYVSRILYSVSGIKNKKIRNTKYPEGKPSASYGAGKIQNTKFVGPFVDGRALKQTLNVLRRIFPYRTCKPYSGRPCLWYQLGRCPGSCLLGSKLAKEIPGLKKAIKKESQRNAKNLKKILEGKKTEMLKNLKTEMKNASKIRDFEKAAKIRDQIWALERILSRSKIFDWSEPETSRKRRSPDSYVWEETERNLRKALKIKGRVKRIEAYDISNIQGQNATGSMVTFINGKPDKNFYRKFKVRIEDKPNDVAMLKEILSRRFQHPEWGWPDMILIDGGKAQLNIALQCLNSPRYHPPSAELRGKKFKHVKAMALAKRENKLFIEGERKPILLKTLPREIFNLILQLRDEAHRFAIAYHRKLRDIDPVVKF